MLITDVFLAVNAGVLGAVGYFSYANWDRPIWDRRIVSTVSVGVLALWSGEGYVLPPFGHVWRIDTEPAATSPSDTALRTTEAVLEWKAFLP